MNLDFSSVKGRRLSAFSINSGWSAAAGPNAAIVPMLIADKEWDVFGAVAGGQFDDQSGTVTRLKAARLAPHSFVSLFIFLEWATNGTGNRMAGHYSAVGGGGTFPTGGSAANGSLLKSAASIPTRHNFWTTYNLAINDTLEIFAAQDSGGPLDVTETHLGFIVIPQFRTVSAKTFRITADADTLTTGIDNLIEWTDVVEDEFSWYSAGDPTKITFDRSAYITGHAQCDFAANATGDRSLVCNFNDGGLARIISGDSCDANASFAHTSNVSFLQYVEAGDYLEFPALHTVGSDLAMLGASLEIGIHYLP